MQPRTVTPSKSPENLDGTDALDQRTIAQEKMLLSFAPRMRLVV
jgi:hypothetical protein